MRVKPRSHFFADFTGALVSGRIHGLVPGGACSVLGPACDLPKP